MDQDQESKTVFSKYFYHIQYKTEINFSIGKFIYY